MSFTVLSQNAMCWEHKPEGTFALRRPLMLRAIKNSGAAVVGFQEVTPKWEEMLAADLHGWEHYLVYRHPDNLEATPVYWDPAVLTALERGHFWLSETPEVPSLGWDAKCVRITTWILFEENATGKRFALVNTHLDHRGEQARINGIAQICDFVKDKFGAGMPLVLTGDFNATPDTPTLQKANELLTDARKAAKISTGAPTFHGFQDLKAVIDYVYISDNITCDRFSVIDERDGDSHQSDHCGAAAEITL